MIMTWEERYRMLMRALKRNREFWTPWLSERITRGPERDFFCFPQEEIDAASDLIWAMKVLAHDMRNDPDYEPTEV